MVIEMAIALPLLLTLLVSAMVVGRTANAVSAVEMAAYDGARTASLARDGDTARTEVAASVHDSLQRQGYSCARPPRVVVTGVPEDPWSTPAGTPASVVVEVSCQVSYLDISVPGMAAGRTVTRHFVSPIDRYRARP